MKNQLRLASNSMRAPAQKDDYLGDLISQLADELLVLILSRLTLKEAQRTCVLSRRWRYLWASVPNLNLDASNTLNRLAETTFNARRMKEFKELVELERARYVSWVNQVLRSHSGLNITEFRVQFDLNGNSRSDIDGWVNFAITKGLRKLELDFLPHCACSQGDNYRFPNIGSWPSGFSISFLRSVVFTWVNVTEEVIEYFLFNCPLLEDLSVICSLSLVKLRIVGSSLRLKYLDLSFCPLKSIEVCAPNLVSFKLVPFKHCGNVTLALMDIPRLVEVSMGACLCNGLFYHTTEHSRYFSQLETLTLDILFEEHTAKYLNFPNLSSLKELVLIFSEGHDLSLLGFASLIKAAPMLRRLKLKLRKAKEMQRIVETVGPNPHQNLKLVEFVDFVGAAIDFAVVAYLLENAIALEKIIIDPRVSRGTKIYEREWESRERVARDRAKQLESMLPLGVKLVII
ncbi:UDP-glycosyltransferase [Sarracenia purpurea var. burkii]